MLRINWQFFLSVTVHFIIKGILDTMKYGNEIRTTAQEGKCIFEGAPSKIANW